MIYYYTRYKVKQSFNRKELLDLGFECVSGMKNVPDSFCGISWDGSNSGEWREGRDLLAYEIDEDYQAVAFRVAIVDQNEELWTTDTVLDEKTHEIQLRLAREKRKISAEYDNSFRIPYFFKKIVRDGLAGGDYDLEISGVPFYIDENNVSIIEDIINRKREYALPVVYVSHPFLKDEYEVDVNELAKDMAGCAHVLVEKRSQISSHLKETTGGRNPYNGAIDVIYSDSSFRYIGSPDKSTYQLRQKIIHAIYSRMAMRNIDDEISLSAIKIRNKIRKLNSRDLETQKLVLENENLREKIKDETEFIQFISDENNIKDKRINELENEIFDLKNKTDALSNSLKRKNRDKEGVMELIYTETPYYDDEIKRMVLECIRNTVVEYGDDEKIRRDYHVLNDIISHNQVSGEGERIKREMKRIIKKNRLNGTDENELKRLGFELQKGAHDKYLFHNDDRYMITVSNSPSDHRSGENIAHEAVNLLFGRT